MTERTIIGLGDTAAHVVALSYEQTMHEIACANSRRSEVVELPVDWLTGGDGSGARASAIGLRYIRYVKSWPS